MANTFTNIGNTILSQKVLEAFKDYLAPLLAFSTSLNDEAAQRGDKVKVLSIPTQDPAADRSPTGTYSMQDADADGIDVTINKWKYVSWALTDWEISQMALVELDRFADAKGYQLAKAVITDILSAVTLANYGAAVFTGAAADFDYDSVVDIGTACDTAGWPSNMRSLVIGAAYKGALLKDVKISDAAAIASADPKRSRNITPLSGFDIYSSTAIPGNSQNLVGFAARPEAMLVAMRYLKPQEGHNYTIAQPMSDAETGITLGLRRWYDPDAGQMRTVMECVYGSAIGTAAALKRIVSA